ncbi:GPI [Acanthosepion pharaonis]|uniref:GPI n=1 Tax=Acanthosepion pharaonis TaxID=158019 RepID=A0A812DNU5_ACAPH|nr:GPI [Sepia pharaonis]
MALEEVFALRPRRDPAGRRLQDLHHHRDDAQRHLGAAMDDRAWRRGPPWPHHRADRQPGQGGRMGRMRRASVLRRVGGGRYSLWSTIGFPPRWARLGRVRGTAGGRGRNGPPFPPDRPPARTPRARRLCRPFYYTWSAMPRRARPSPMTSACASCPPIPAVGDGVERQASLSTASRWTSHRRDHRGASAPMRSMRCSSFFTRGRIWSPSNLSRWSSRAMC